MNPVALKGLAKMVKNMIPPEAIGQAVEAAVKSAIDYKNQIELEPGEVNAVGLVYEVEGEAYTAIAVLNAENFITRFENVRPLKELAAELIAKM